MILTIYGKVFIISIEIENEAKKELAAHYKSGDRKTIKRIERIFKELAETPYDGIGSPEPLKYELSGLLVKTNK